MPSTDLSGQRWDFRGSLNLNKLTKTGSLKVPGVYRNSLVKVEIAVRGLRDSWNQLGYLHQTHAGTTHPQGHYLSVHTQLIQLANLAPYGLFIQLRPWIVSAAQSGSLTGSIRVYESGATLPPSDLQNLSTYQKQAIMLVNPIKVDLPEVSDLSTKFTRSIAAQLPDGASVVLAGVNEDRTGLVLRNNGSYDVYLCLAATATANTAIAKIEPDGYYELSPSDYNGVISVICFGGVGSVAGSEMSAKEQIGGVFVKTASNVFYWRVMNGALQNSSDGQTVLNASFADGVTAAEIDVNGGVYLRNANGSFRLNDADLATGFIAVEAAEYPSSGLVNSAYVLL
jgi:hypothetical protein